MVIEWLMPETSRPVARVILQADVKLGKEYRLDGVEARQEYGNSQLSRRLSSFGLGSGVITSVGICVDLRCQEDEIFP